MEMSLGEKSILTISGYEHALQGAEANFPGPEINPCQMANVSYTYSDYAYGDR